MIGKLREYLIGAVAEMKKVTWPSRKQTVNYSLVVVAMSLGVAVFFGILDYAFTFGLDAIIK